MSKPYWQGVFPAITTQLKKDQSLDFDATARHVEALLASGVTGIVFLGSLGENQPLRGDEKRQLMEAMVGVVNGRVPVLSGVAETSTAEACRYVRDVEALGADGFMLMPAMCNKHFTGSINDSSLCKKRKQDERWVFSPPPPFFCCCPICV